MSEKGISSLFKSKLGIGIAIITVVVAGGLVGYVALNSTASKSPATEYYVLAYHWGYVLYDSNFNEITGMNVTKGTHVQIHLLSAGGLTMELHESLEERNANNTLAGFNAGDVDEAMEAAEGGGLLAHSLQIDGAYSSKGAITTSDAVVNATSVQSLATQLKDMHKLPTLDFTANSIGSFKIYCTVYCGDYHSDMYLKNALVVT